MKRAPAERRTTSKLAVVGVDTPAGALVRGELEATAVPGDRVDLYGVSGSEAVLSEYLGEARLIQAADEAALASHDLVFVCSREAASGVALDRSTADRLVIDLGGAGRAELAHSRLRPIESGATGVWRVAHPIALFLIELLEPMSGVDEIEHVTATVLRPAGDLGEPGVEELRGQISGLLNFGELPTDVFGARLAFGCLPQAGDGERSPEVEDRIRRDVRELMTGRIGRFSAHLAWIPTFFGHTASVHVRTVASSGAVADRLAAATGVELVESPAECRFEDDSGGSGVIVARPRADEEGGFWIWAVAEELGVAAAREAVGLARAAGRL